MYVSERVLMRLEERMKDEMLGSPKNGVMQKHGGRESSLTQLEEVRGEVEL
jgi:hypothetical protein